MKLIRCACCLALVYASILTRAGEPSPKEPAHMRSDAASALQAAGDAVDRVATHHPGVGLSAVCVVRPDVCGGTLAAIVTALDANAKPVGADAARSSITAAASIVRPPLPVPDPRRHARPPIQTEAP